MVLFFYVLDWQYTSKLSIHIMQLDLLDIFVGMVVFFLII